MEVHANKLNLYQFHLSISLLMALFSTAPAVESYYLCLKVSPCHCPFTSMTDLMWFDSIRPCKTKVFLQEVHTRADT